MCGLGSKNSQVEPRVIGADKMQELIEYDGGLLKHNPDANRVYVE